MIKEVVSPRDDSVADFSWLFPLPIEPRNRRPTTDCLNETAFFSVASNPSSLSFPRSQVTATVPRRESRETRHYRRGDLALVSPGNVFRFPADKVNDSSKTGKVLRSHRHGVWNATGDANERETKTRDVTRSRSKANDLTPLKRFGATETGITWFSIPYSRFNISSFDKFLTLDEIPRTREIPTNF